MKIIHYLFYFLPYILILLVIFMINNIISVRHKEDKLNIYGILGGIAIIIILSLYYLPTKNILKNYTLNFMSVYIVNKQQSIQITDKEKVDKLIDIINSHTFIRSAARTVRQQNFADSQYVMIGTHNEQPWKMIQLFILKDNIKNNALEINDQMYNVKDKARLSEEIFEALKDLEYYEIPYDYKWDLALKNGDVVDVGGKIYNLEKLEGFIKAFKGNKVFESDMIRITTYTKEGHALINILTSSSEGVKLITDNTRDKWSAAERRKRVEHKVVDIIQEDIFDGVGYEAITDKGEKILLFHVGNK